MYRQKTGLARIAFAFVLLALGLVPAASAATSQFQILLNLDNQINTGCDVTTLTGTFDGVEQILITTVDTVGSSAAQVTALEIQNCVSPASNTFGPPSPVAAPPGRPLPWPVGVSNGTDGSSVIETYYPLSLSTVPNLPVVRIGVLGVAGGTVQDELLRARPTPGPNGPPILIQALGVPDIPTLSEWALILLSLALFAAAMMVMRRRTATAFLFALLLLGLAGAAWAIAGDLDGNTTEEWGAPLATETFAEVGADAPPGTDIRALFGFRCNVLNAICFRIDAVLQYSAAIDDAATVAEDSGATTINVLANDIGGPYTIDSVTQPANGTVAITNAGADLAYTPDADFCGTDTFTYTVMPGGFTATVTVTVTCVDDPPTAVDDMATVAEDAPATAIDVLANDTDPDAGPRSIQSVTQPANGTVVITGGGTGLTYQPNANYCNTPPGTTLDTFTYTLTPGGSTATVSVTVTCFDNPPVAVADAATVNEDSGANTIDVLANDTDIDGGPISVASVTPPANGAVVITNGGADLAYTPNANYCGADSFTYTLAPGGSTATVTVTVTCVNDDPVAVDDAATVAEDSGATAVSVLANDTDVESDPFTIQSVTQPANGTVVITGGGTGLTYQPNPNYCNAPPGTTLDTFTYTLTPGGSTATVSMTVTCEDDDPVAVDDAATVDEDSGANAIDVLANDTDVDAGPISVTSVTQGANGTVTVTGGGTGLTYTPNADFCGTDSFTYTLAPGGSAATVTVTVTCADDNPVAVPDAATVNEDSGANAIDVLANDTDVDAGPISIASVTQGTSGTVVITGGGTGLTYQPNANYCGADSFTYTLTPGGSSTTVTVTVTCVDDDPTAVADAATVAEDSGANPIPVLANDTDPDGGAISITSVTQGTNGTVAITGGGTGLTYQPNANYCGADSFTYTLTPGGSTATVTVTVTCADDNPVAVADAATVNEDSGANPINVLANDIDIDAGPISITSVTQGTNGAVAITNGGADLTYTPNANYCGADSFTYTLTPGGSTATVTVTVTCLNDGPVIDLDADDDKGTGGSDFAVTFTEGNPATLIEDPVDATVTDPDSATLASLTVTITNLLDTGFETLSADVSGTSIVANYAVAPGEGTLTLTGPDTVANFQTVLRTVTYLNTDVTPDATPRVIEFVANDGITDGNTAVSTVTVVSVDTDPTAVADAATVNEDAGATTIDVLANDTDPDAGPISITSVTQPANGTVVITNGGADLTYQPNANYCGADSFTYTLTPGGSTATVSVTVTCEDDNPVAVADAATVAEDSGANAIPVLANDTDADGGPISITSVTQGTSGTVVITGGGTGLTYQPNADYCGADSFTYTLTPGGSTATVTVTVTCVDDNPVAVADAATVVEDSTNNAIDVLANDTDVDGGAISITSVTQGANGTVVITGGGTGVAYTPNADYCGADSFTYTLTPGGSTATVTVTVTCVDDPPVAVADAATVVEDSTNNAINVLANDTDPDAGPISITSVTQPANGTVVITGGGTGLTYTPNANYCNSISGPLETFTYTLTPASATPTATVTVTVTCVNDPPVADNDTFDFIGNTELVVDLAALSTPHALETTGTGLGVLDGDSDPVENDAISVTSITVGSCTDASAPLDCSDPAVGRVQMQPNGRFIFTPAPGDAGATETFQYTVTDDGVPAPASTTATVTLTRFERVWYVKNDAPAGGNGTSASPFNSITAANLSDNDSDGDLTDDLDSAGDYIFVYFGTGNATNQSTGLVLENGQHLIGHHAGLSLNVNLNGNGAPTNLVAASAGNRPHLDDTVVDAFEGVSARNVIPAEIVGMNLAGNVNGIDWTTTAAFAGTGELSIRDNVIRSAGNEGVDINLAGTGATRLAFHDNNLTSTGTAVDIQETGTGTLTITAFDDNIVSGNTGGSGIIVSNARFDSVPGGGLNTVNGGTTIIGASGNGVGGAGLALGNVQGDLHFTGNLNIFADGGAGLTVSGTGVGMTLRVNSGGAPTGIIEATGGPAVDATGALLDLRLTSLRSTNSASTGTSLTNTTGTFSAEPGSSITNATGTDFAISGGTANVTYKGTITDDVGQLVSVSGSSGGTKSFEGAITDGDDGDGSGVSLSGNTAPTIVRFSGGLVLSTGGNAAFAATGGGTVEVCDENPCNGAATGGLINKITTTTGTALNVANTNIGAGNLEFRSISANGAPSGIILNSTGSNGSLLVKGNGGSCTSAATCTGGSIQSTTGDGISLSTTRAPSLTRLFVSGSGSHGINATSVNNGLTLTSSFVTNSGNADNEYGLNLSNLTGTATISGTTFNNAADDLVHFVNNNTNGNLTVNGGSSFIYPASISATANAGIAIQPNGTSNVTVTVQGATFTNIKSDSIQWGAATAGSNGTSTLDFSNNTITVNTAGRASGFSLSCQESTTGNITIANNSFSGAGGNGVISIDCNDSSLLAGSVSGNTITNPPGIGMLVAVDEASEARLTLNGNVVANSGGDGIQVVNFGGVGVSELYLALTNNQVNGHSANTSVNFVGGISVTSFEDNSCIELRGNAVTGTPASPTQCGGAPCVDYYIEEVGGAMTFEEVPNTASTTLSAAYVNSTNDAGPVTIFGTIDLSNGAQCPFP